MCETKSSLATTDKITFLVRRGATFYTKYAMSSFQVQSNRPARKPVYNKAEIAEKNRLQSAVAVGQLARQVEKYLPGRILASRRF